jgi:non-canonical poly(A) RNA polymerase PAPD5/7
MHPKLRNGEIDQSKNVGVLLIEFFELYGNYFNYQTTGLCLCDGGSYFTKHTRGWKPEFLSIEDPCDIGLFTVYFDLALK